MSKKIAREERRIVEKGVIVRKARPEDGERISVLCEQLSRAVAVDEVRD